MQDIGSVFWPVEKANNNGKGFSRSRPTRQLLLFRKKKHRERTERGGPRIETVKWIINNKSVIQIIRGTFMGDSKVSNEFFCFLTLMEVKNNVWEKISLLNTLFIYTSVNSPSCSVKKQSLKHVKCHTWIGEWVGVRKGPKNCQVLFKWP